MRERTCARPTAPDLDEPARKQRASLACVSRPASMNNSKQEQD